LTLQIITITRRVTFLGRMLILHMKTCGSFSYENVDSTTRFGNIHPSLKPKTHIQDGKF
jgi:hypothetical protein